MGNLLLDNDNLKSKKNGSENMAYVGYSYRNEYKTGIQFNYYESISLTPPNNFPFKGHDAPFFK